MQIYTVVLQQVMGEDQVSLLLLIHVLRVLERAMHDHVAGLLYQLAKFKMMKLRAVLEDVAKTSQPNTCHQPRGEKIAGDEVQLFTAVGCSKHKVVSEKTEPRPTLDNFQLQLS